MDLLERETCSLPTTKQVFKDHPWSLLLLDPLVHRLACKKVIAHTLAYPYPRFLRKNKKNTKPLRRVGVFFEKKARAQVRWLVHHFFGVCATSNTVDMNNYKYDDFGDFPVESPADLQRDQPLGWAALLDECTFCYHSLDASPKTPIGGAPPLTPPPPPRPLRQRNINHTEPLRQRAPYRLVRRKLEF